MALRSWSQQKQQSIKNVRHGLNPSGSSLFCVQAHGHPGLIYYLLFILLCNGCVMEWIMKSNETFKNEAQKSSHKMNIRYKW